MFRTLSFLLEVFHAALMVAWVLALPLMLWRRHPRLAGAAAIYAAAFAILSQGSQWILGECFITSWARWLWQRRASEPIPPEWFTIKLAKAIFRVTPSERSVVLVSYALVVATAAAVLLMLRRSRFHQGDRPEFKNS